jgi:LemA protein
MTAGNAMIWSGIVIVFLVVLASYIIIMFNSLVRLKNSISKAWSNIDVLLKQRYDELPNLVSTVKGYMKHEKETLTLLTKMRAMAMKDQTMQRKAAMSDIVAESIKSIFAVAENYPNLKANESFLKLQERITGLENEIADRREFYNDSVYLYNTRIQSFPDMLLAKALKYTPEEMFKATDEERKAVAVSISG